MANKISPRPPAAIVFTQWPLRDEGLRAALPILGILGISLIGGGLSSSFCMGLLAGGASAVAIWRYWFPMTIEFNASGIALSCFGRKRRSLWNDLYSFHFQSRGVVFTTANKGLLPAALEGGYIRLGNRQEAVQELVQFYCSSSSDSEHKIETTVSLLDE